MKKLLSKVILVSLVVVSLVSCSPKNQNNNNVSGDNNSTNQSSSYIDEQKAKSIALEHAKLSEKDVNIVKVERDRDDNKEKYEVEFWKDNKEYDYEIDALSGEILSYDYDIENYDIPSSNQSESVAIDENKAKEIALGHAKLSSQTKIEDSGVKFVKVELDVDDGRKEYDVVFHYENKEYEYQIDANTGDVIEYEIDNID